MNDEKLMRIGMLKAMPGKWDVVGNWEVFETQFEAHGQNVDVLMLLVEEVLEDFMVMED